MMQPDKTNNVSHGQQPCLLVLSFCSMAIMGCAIFETDVTQMFKKEPKFQTPHQMIPLWTDTVLHQLGDKARRGCGGRFMFYTEESKESIRVDGAVMVYVWDDSRTGHQRKPDRKYVFRADSLQTHYSKSKVGHSYSFWIPWDDAGSDRCELTVVARFLGQNGVDITAPASKVILPGPVSMSSNSNDVQLQDIGQGQVHHAGGVQQVSWGKEHKAHLQSRQTLRSSEIYVSPGFVRRNQQAAIEGFSAAELFADEYSGSPANNILDTDPRSESSDFEETEGAKVSGELSAQHAVRSLQSRLRARRGQAAQRSAFAVQTEPSRRSAQ